MYQPSPLDLISYGVYTFNISTNDEYDLDSNESPYFLNAKYDVKHRYGIKQNDENIFFIELRISVTPKPKNQIPYNIKLRLAGVFHINEKVKFPKDKRDILIVNATSILYGIAREYVSLATCHSKGGSLMLPSVSFAPKVKRPRKKQEASTDN